MFSKSHGRKCATNASLTRLAQTNSVYPSLLGEDTADGWVMLHVWHRTGSPSGALFGFMKGRIQAKIGRRRNLVSHELDGLPELDARIWGHTAQASKQARSSGPSRRKKKRDPGIRAQLTKICKKILVGIRICLKRRLRKRERG